LIISLLVIDPPSLTLYNTGLSACMMLPPLLFGFLAYRQRQAGLPRVLAIIGVGAGVAGAINFIIVAIGGGDYTNPNNPDLAPLIDASWGVAALFALIWVVWTGVVLLRLAGASQRQPA